MNKALFLGTNITIAELEECFYQKNDDPATLLPAKNHDYLNMFSQKKADILPIHRA